MNGKFIISLDYELHWGVFDALPLNAYKSNLLNVNDVVTKLLELSDKYGIKLTFATVGLLFAENKAEIEKHMPDSIPLYDNENLNPFKLLGHIGKNESLDTIHYAKSAINKIKSNNNHEIGTHTFGHYNCLAPGQNTVNFNSDLVAAKKIANSIGVEIKSIVFPKNQVNKNYLEVCKKNGITSYRGNENHVLYNPNPNLKGLKKHLFIIYRFLRLLDSYINISGFNTYPIQNLKPNDLGLVNLPSSRFLRPYVPRLSILEGFKLRRIKKAMKHAAINNELFHLWWHPHNFGANMDENFKNLELIFQEYTSLNKKFNFQSDTMTGLTNKILNTSAIK
ncbi:polysaccharide deacetylase family protein [Hwangdonia lutea]|uniref:Polysaccharide deacetylase family protein n=1 Tax=Hwangdonia lutea TaxID=3075823 RepID=A0AA97HQV5_9FLAO|nr:polysaccharide deacetylase family protein [Hwangdonia sp. SCSIO 19198]WOD43365.1 polysaccharide deacetylase family protein [Hwangdonia sp. SCSIO 19198]